MLVSKPHPPSRVCFGAAPGASLFLTTTKGTILKGMNFQDMVWSPSRLNTLFLCPRKFYYQYILGDKGDEERSEAAELGKAVHELLEISVLGKPVDEHLFDVAEKYSLTPDSRREILEMLPNIKEFSKKVREHPDIEKIATELEIKNGLFQGILDLTIHFKGDHFFVIDHKTTKMNIRTEEDIPWDYQVQLLIYGYLVATKIQSAQKISTGIHVIRFGKTVKKHIVKPKEFFISKVKELVDRAQNILLREKNKWSPRPSWKCRFCQYQKTCEALA